MNKKVKRILAFVLTFVMVVSNMGMMSLNVRAEEGSTSPVILYKDDFENYETGTDVASVSGGDISVSGSGVNVTVDENTEESNKYLYFAGNANADYTFKIPLKQNGEVVAYNDNTPLWVEMSFKQSTDTKDGFRHWYVNAINSENSANNLFKGEYHTNFFVNGTRIGNSFFDNTAWKKVIMKLDMQNDTYSLWLDKYEGNAIASGSVTLENIRDIAFYIEAHSSNSNRKMLVDNIAVYSASEYVDVFSADFDDTTGGGDNTGGETESPVIATTPGVYYKDNFEGYTTGDNTFNGEVIYSGTGSNVAVASGVDGENLYLKFGEGTANEGFELNIPLQQEGQDVIYQDTTLPLWIEMSFRQQDKDGFRYWNVKVNDAEGSGVTELFEGEYHTVFIVNETKVGTSFFDNTGWKKVIMKLDMNSKVYSIWFDNCEGNPVATGSIDSENIRELKFEIESHSANSNRSMLVDDIAIFASETFTTQFPVDGSDSGEGSGGEGEGGENSGSGNQEPEDRHNYDNACDESCNDEDCEYVRVAASHVYDAPEDADCNICGATRIPSNGTTIAYRYFNNDNIAFSDISEIGGTVSVNEGKEENGYLELKGTGTGEYKFAYSLSYDNQEVPLWIRMDVAMEEKSPILSVFRVKGTGSWPRTYLFKNEEGVLYGTDNQNEKVEDAVLGSLNAQWMNLAFKIDPANKTYTAYVDGVEKYTGPHTISDEGKISLVEFYVASNANNADSVLKIDNFEIYTDTPVDTEVEEPNTPVAGSDVEMDHPELADIGNGIAVMAGEAKAYANNADISLAAAPMLNDAGTDILVSGSFIKTYLGIENIDESGSYPLAETAKSIGKNAVFNTRGVVVVTDSDIVLDTQEDVKLLTLIAGYLERGQEKINYAISPSFTQEIIDEAVALEPAGFLSTGGNHEPAEKSIAALYYLALVTYSDDSAAATNGTLCKDAALVKIRHLIAGGNEPYACVGPYWSHAVAASALVLVKNTPAIYDKLTADEKDRMDWLMKGLAIAGNWGFNDANNYGTGFDMLGNFGKAWNPNYRNAYLTVVMSASMYFGATELDAIFTSFDYETYIAKYEELGFTNILATWKTTDYDGVSVGKLMEEGGSCRLLGGIGLAGDSAGDSGGSGAGVKIPFTYSGYTTSQLCEIFTSLVKYTYAWNVMNEYNIGTDIHCYIISGKESPFTGKMGMMREYAATGGRSRTSYGWDSYYILNTVYANMKLFGGWDSSTTEMRKLDNRIYVGNEDLIFKMQEGYRGHSNGNQADEYEYNFESRGNKYTKDVWRNFHCMQNTAVTTIKDPNVNEEVLPAEPMDGIVEAPEGALEAIYLNNQAYFPETAFYNIGDELESGTIEFDIVMGDGIHITEEIEEGYFDACVMLGKKEENIIWSNVNMTIQLMGGAISIRDGGVYKKTGMSFSSNHRYHAKITFDVPNRTYSVEFNRIYPEVGEVYKAENYAFRTSGNQIDFVDSLILVMGNEGSDYWLENVKIVKDTEELGNVEILEEGMDTDYTLNSNQEINIHCTGELADFVGIFVDNNEVDSAMYTLEEGSTIIKLKPEFLNTLSVGEHEITLCYTGERSVSMILSVESEADGGGNAGGSGSDDSGDNTGGGATGDAGDNDGSGGSDTGEGNTGGGATGDAGDNDGSGGSDTGEGNTGGGATGDAGDNTGNSGTVESEDVTVDNLNDNKNEQDNSIKNSNTSATGDDSNFVLYSFISILSFIVIAILMKLKKKES